MLIEFLVNSPQPARITLLYRFNTKEKHLSFSYQKRLFTLTQSFNFYCIFENIDTKRGQAFN